MYIGSIYLSKRIAEHFLYGKSNEHLQRALALYGLDNFEFLIIEFCTPELLIEREQYYLNWLFSLP
jgi:group I intron endonuclease